MKQNKTYLHLGVTLIVSACAVLMFYDTFLQSRVLLDFFDKLMQVLSPVIMVWRSRTFSPPSSTFSTDISKRGCRRQNPRSFAV